MINIIKIIKIKIFPIILAYTIVYLVHNIIHYNYYSYNSYNLSILNNFYLIYVMKYCDTNHLRMFVSFIYRYFYILDKYLRDHIYFDYFYIRVIIYSLNFHITVYKDYLGICYVDVWLNYFGILLRILYDLSFLSVYYEMVILLYFVISCLR